MLSQTYRFGAALEEAYGEYSYEPRLFEFEDGCLALLPVVRAKGRLPLVRMFLGMPLSLSGAPIVLRGRPGPAHALAMLRKLRPDSFVLHFGMDDPIWAGDAAQLGMRVIPGTTHVLNLESGFAQVWERSFTGKVRNQCRTAERRGIEVRFADEADDFDTYYSLYREATRVWGYAAPPYPRSLFTALASLAGQGVRLLLAQLGGEIVAGVLLFEAPDSVLYWSGAMRRAHAPSCPTNALLKSAIRNACERGARLFDFGASGALDNVRRYKESFGAMAAATCTWRYESGRYRAMQRLRGAFVRGVPA